MTSSVYIHIPFCRQKCKYCSFVSFPWLDRKEQYLKVLKQEIQNKYKGEVLKTLYFGGGTPSLLSLDDLVTLLTLFEKNNDTEITLEINPETVDRQYLEGLKNIGVNRLSIGCQSFDDDILRAIGRIHTAQQVEKVVKQAQSVGFGNISLDFIYGLPNQSLESFSNDLKKAITLGVQHISLYGLKIEEGSYFYKNSPQNIATVDEQADMYLSAVQILESQGFEHYEISNFSKNGYNSRHNLVYWNNENYYGFGLSAHGYLNNIRYSNFCDLDDYLENTGMAELETKLLKSEQLEEEIFLGLRRMKGINCIDINRKYDINFEEKYKNILVKYLDSGHIQKTLSGYKLTLQGVLISNMILSEFLED